MHKIILRPRLSRIAHFIFDVRFLTFWVFLIFCGIQTSFSQNETSIGKQDKILKWWSFNTNNGNFTTEEIQQTNDSIYGNFGYVPGISGNALKLDGFSSFVRKNPNNFTGLTGPFTVESWIALASYPWSWSPIADCSSDKIKGFFFGIDQEGHIGFKIAAGNSWYELSTEDRILLGNWNHLAAVFEPDKKISLYINGKKAATLGIKGNFIPSRRGTLTIGRNNNSQTWNEFQLTTPDTYFFLDGLLDEIKISEKLKTEDEISKDFLAVKNIPVPELSNRTQFPKGAVGSGSFGAFYTRLNYYKEWDDLWRVSDVPDIFVRFDQSPVQIVFWRGASFVPCWVTENDIWYTNEWLETWGSDVVSCAEPIMDRQCRYSHVRLIENTEARVVIHWRYALNDAFYDFAAVSDDGRGEWCDEFHIIYPDMVGVRKMELHYSKPERKHDWVEQIVVLPPGKYPDDVIEKDGISLINMSGEVQQYSWHNPDLKIEMPEPKGANMSLVNLKSKYRPFIVVAPDPVETVEGKWDSPFFRTYASKMAQGGYSPDPVPSVYGWWNHWPVAQVPGDGRWVTAPDKPSHFNLTTFVQWKDYDYNDQTRTRIMLQGVTDKKAEELVPLAKSWLQAPKMKIISESFKGGFYDQSEKAYMLEKVNQNKLTRCEFLLQASKESPLSNPAIIIKNWGNHLAKITIDGKNLEQGNDFRQGIRKGSEGDDLILWIRLDRQNPVEIVLE